MSTYYNEKTYHTFKMLHGLNNLEDVEVIIDKQDIDIINAIYKDFFIKDVVEFDVWLDIVKKISIDMFIHPVKVALMIRDELKKNDD